MSVEASEKLLKVQDVAERLNASPSLVYQAISEGRLKCHRIGKGQGGIRISHAQLEMFLRGSVWQGEPGTGHIR